MTVHTTGKFECKIKNVINLLKKANFSATDEKGFMHVFNSACKWELRGSKESDLAAIERDRLLFQAFGADSQIVKVTVHDTHCFSMWCEANPKKVNADGVEFFDFNWYYVNMISAFNGGERIVEKIVFEQY